MSSASNVKMEAEETTAVVPRKACKREDYLGWDSYFMATALLAAKRSKDPSTQVGTCIVNENNIIVGVGYNGFPRGCSDDKFTWGKDCFGSYNQKYLYVCHAAINAVLNKNCCTLKGCIMYTTLFPCNECAKIIIQSQIKEIVYMSDKYSEKSETKAAKAMFESAKIIVSEFKGNLTVTVDVEEEKN